MRETERGSAATVARTPSLDLLFDVLSNRRRRYVLYYLQDLEDGVATIEEIAAQVASLEGVADERRERGYPRIVSSLQHAHVPKLEEAGIVDYDPRSETLRYWEQPSFEELIEHARHKELA